MCIFCSVRGKSPCSVDSFTLFEMEQCVDFIAQATVKMDTVCRFYSKGHCKDGASCPLQHSDHPKRIPDRINIEVKGGSEENRIVAEEPPLNIFADYDRDFPPLPGVPNCL